MHPPYLRSLLVIIAIKCVLVKCHEYGTKGEIIYDLTRHLDKMLTSKSSNKWQSFNTTIANTSTFLYSTDSPLVGWLINTLPKMRTLLDQLSIPKLIVAFEISRPLLEKLVGDLSRNHQISLDFKESLQILDGIIISMHGFCQHENEIGNPYKPELLANLKYFLTNKLKATWVKVLLTYFPSNMACPAILNEAKFSDQNVLIVKFDSNLEGKFVNSFPFFKSRLDYFQKKQVELFNKSMNSNPNVIFWPKIIPSEVKLNAENNQRAMRTLSSFSQNWAEETGRGIIVEYAETSTSTSSIFSEQISDNVTISWVVPTLHSDENNGKCGSEIVAAIDSVSNVFSTFYLDVYTWSCWIQLLEQIPIQKQYQFILGQTYKVKTQQPKFLAENSLYIDPETFLQIYESHELNSDFVGLIIPQDLLGKEVNCSSENFTQVMSIYLQQIHVGFNIPFGKVSTFLRNKNTDLFIDGMCTSEKSFSSFLVLEYILNFDDVKYRDSPYEYFESVLKELDLLSILKTDILLKFPEKTIYLRILSKVTDAIKADINQGIYCGKELVKMESLLEAVINWAEMANFIAIVKDLIDYESMISHHTSWLRTLHTFGPYDWTKGGFFSSQNLHIIGKSGGESCIDWTSHVPSEMSLNHRFMGSSIDIQGATSIAVFMQLIKLARKKFQNLNIVASSKTFLSEDFTTIARELKSSNLTSCRIDLRIENSSQKSIKVQFEIFGNVSGKFGSNSILKGIHISQWEVLRANSIFENLLNDFIQHTASQGIEVGLNVKNCKREVEAVIARSEPTYLENITYIICESEKIQASNLDKFEMTTFFDKHLLIKKLLKRRLPNLNIFFRLNLGFSNNNQTIDEAYLKFINDVNSFSKAYRIHYYIDAGNNLAEKQIGWWNINEFSDHSKGSQYVERKSAYHLRFLRSSVENTTTTTPGNIVKHSNNLELIILFVVCFLLFILISGVAVWKQVRKRDKLLVLSKKELERFYIGSEHGSPNGIQDAREFVKAFEIPKAEFKLDPNNIIGSGNFGTVYKDHLRERNVAVKVPKVMAGNGKESFLNMLTEVKTLCYVGSHPNVIEFVGAYTLEIYSGVLYIATELCELGSLLSYLEKKREEVLHENTDVNRMELIKFCAEIAAGMEYIGLQEICHGDISTRNVLLTKQKVCKIGDFGLSRKLVEDKYVKRGDDPLPWRWMAYESLTRKEFTTMSDVWGYGITIWEVFSLGDLPFGQWRWNPEFEENIKNGIRLDKPKHSCDESFQIMKSCWNIQPALRPKFENLRKAFANMGNSDYLF